MELNLPQIFNIEATQHRGTRSLEFQACPYPIDDGNPTNTDRFLWVCSK